MSKVLLTWTELNSSASFYPSFLFIICCCCCYFCYCCSFIYLFIFERSVLLLFFFFCPSFAIVAVALLPPLLLFLFTSPDIILWGWPGSKHRLTNSSSCSSSSLGTCLFTAHNAQKTSQWLRSVNSKTLQCGHTGSRDWAALFFHLLQP